MSVDMYTQQDLLGHKFTISWPNVCRRRLSTRVFWMKTQRPRATAQSLCLSAHMEKLMRSRSDETEILGSFRNPWKPPNQKQAPWSCLAVPVLTCYTTIPGPISSCPFEQRKIMCVLLGMRAYWVAELGDVKQKKPDAEPVYFALLPLLHSGVFQVSVGSSVPSEQSSLSAYVGFYATQGAAGAFFSLPGREHGNWSLDEWVQCQGSARLVAFLT